MALTPRLDLRQSQLLVMTPQLQQAIKLLQFSSMELSDYVDTQLECNPLLERDEGADGFDAGESPAAADAMQPATADGEPRSLDTAVSEEGGSFADDDLDLEIHDNVYDGDYADGESRTSDAFAVAPRQGKGGSFEEHGANPEEMISSQTTLKDHLMSQLAVEVSDPVDRIIGVHLIDMLDEAGYLTGDLAYVAELLGCPVERVEATLVRLQEFDPSGVFARSLAECLALQLRDQGCLDAAAQSMLDHLDLLARRDWPSLCRVCGIGADQLSKLVALIRTLNPKPALIFDHAMAQPVTPDVIMRTQPGGGWIVELNNDTLPRVLVNNHYYAQVSRAVRNRQDKQYLNECFQSANWLVKSLHQRATTILKVATEIVRQQEAFFVSGVQALKPLVLRDIADAIGMHESTVSRVTSNKFMATPRGIYELKYFFTHAIGGLNGGDVHSAESVRHRIKKMIDVEPPESILSDDALAEALQREGIDIARRTVAKYRESMRIPSSVQRRRQKGAML
jgi:RNA polymerase sigma-54 factor